MTSIGVGVAVGIIVVLLPLCAIRARRPRHRLDERYFVEELAA